MGGTSGGSGWLFPGKGVGSAGRSDNGGMPADIHSEPATGHGLLAEPLPAGSTGHAGSQVRGSAPDLNPDLQVPHPACWPELFSSPLGITLHNT